MKLAIKGNLTRGKEVIELLEMLGGKNVEGFTGIDFEELYTIEDNYIIQAYDWNDCACFTLEEFLEKFPYKVGDKVKLYYQDEENDRYCSDIPSTIISMRWDKSCGKVAYKMEGIKRECYRDEISYDNKDNSNEPDAVITEINLNRTDYADEVEINLSDYEIKVRDGKTFAVLKKLTYPTTYKECCDVLKIPNDERYIDVDVPLNYNKLLTAFTKLLICRDAYWKIAGEEMGLDKPWEPTMEIVYCISRNDNVIKGSYRGGKSNILEFPTEEIRDAFYENFKDLIENCKELL